MASQNTVLQKTLFLSLRMIGESQKRCSEITRFALNNKGFALNDKGVFVTQNVVKSLKKRCSEITRFDRNDKGCALNDRRFCH